jgi:endonuclease YncB( thermonuclease family)
MKLRDALMNLAITAVLVLVIVLVALVLKKSKAAVPKAIPVNPANLTIADQNARPVRETFELLDKTTLVETRANEADTLRFRTGADENIFVLYFVDAIEASTSHPQRINEQARWFGNVNDRLLVETGVEALNYVRDLLKSRPYQVLTRWEQVPNSTRYYALIRVEIQPGKGVYLADLLMQAGYARVQGVTTPLPNDSRDEVAYMLELKNHGDRARTNKAGIWRHVK